MSEGKLTSTEETIKALQSFATNETPEAVAEIAAKGNDIPANDNPPAAEAQTEVNVNTDQPPANTEGDEVQKGDPKTEVPKPITNAMFGDKDLSYKPEPEAEVAEGEGGDSGTIDSLGGFGEYLSDNYGIKSEAEFKSQLEEFNTTKASILEITSQKESLEEAINGMPIELGDAVRAALDGKDWKEHITNAPPVDLRKKVSDFADRELIEAFAPGEFTDSDWDEIQDEDGDPQTKKAFRATLALSKSQFTGLQNNKAKEIEDYSASVGKRESSYLASLDTASSKVASSIEGIDESYVKSITDKVKKEGITSFFMDGNGNLNEDALIKLIKTTSDYEGMIKINENNAVREALNKERQEQLSRGESTPRVRRGTNSGADEVSEEVKKKLEDLRKLTGGGTF
jgi:hypothetical protein